MSRAGPVVLAALLAVATLAPASAVVGATSQPDSPAGDLVQQGEFDSTEFVVIVYPNGSARWTFRYFRTLSNESERTNFEAYAENFRTNETELYTNFRTRADQLTAQGADATGRQMDARNFARDAYTSGPTENRGVVEMSFTWSAFAVVDGDRVVVADVFQGGFYISSDQELRFEAGPDLHVASAEPEPDDSASSGGETQSVTYEGEQEFNDRKPRVVLAPTGSGPLSPTDTSPGSGPGGNGDGNGDGGFGLATMLAVAAVLALAGGAAYAYRSGRFGGGGGGTADAGSAGGGGGSRGVGATEPAVPDEELLSDEDRVLQLLEDHGGRMKQVDIVEETDWSKSKVSMLLSDMEDEDQISKLRVGRENIVSLSGHEPDAAGSPFDDEE